MPAATPTHSLAPGAADDPRAPGAPAFIPIRLPPLPYTKTCSELLDDTRRGERRGSTPDLRDIRLANWSGQGTAVDPPPGRLLAGWPAGAPSKSWTWRPDRGYTASGAGLVPPPWHRAASGG